MYISIIIYFIWIISEVAINRMTRSGDLADTSKDENSLALIWVSIEIIIPVAVYVSMSSSHALGRENIVSPFGLGMILFGVFLRYIIIRSLGKNFTADVSIREEQNLKTDGFYRLVRHPSYTASLISFFGFGISLNNWVSLIMVVVVISAAFWYRIRVEETVLEHHFGKRYLDYEKKTKALLPYLL